MGIHSEKPWKGRSKREAGAVEMWDSRVINLCSSPFPPARLDSRTLGLEWRRSGSLAIGSFFPVLMPNGFLVTGGVSQVAGLGFLAIGDTVDVHP